MFEKFGEFDSAEELNVAAATALEQGDKESVMALAKENGIDDVDAQDYIDGIVQELCSPIMAAFGKLDIEKKALALPEMMEHWCDMLNEMLLSNPNMAAGIRKKGKRMSEFFGQLLKASSDNRKKLPAEIVKAAGLSGTIYVGDIDRLTFKKMATNYYMS